jgi:CheY-like chemotaxis protein
VTLAAHFFGCGTMVALSGGDFSMAGYLRASRGGTDSTDPTPVSGTPAIQNFDPLRPLPGVRTTTPRFERERAVPGLKPTVLVVDDEAVLLRTTRRMLEHRGFSVICVESADAAMAVIDSDRVLDLLITDVGLHRTNGMDLVRRARERRPALRVLYVSGYDAESVGLASGDGRQETFLGKPYTARELDDRLRDLMLPEATAARRNLP